MIPVTIVLKDFSGKYACGDLTEIAAVLNTQVNADYHPVWGGHQTTVLPSTKDSTAWRVDLYDGIEQPGALGYHTDEHHQPYAVIDVSQGDPIVTMSHEIIEMIVDPWGSRLHTVNSWAGWRSYAGVDSTHKQVRSLVELCDPCEQQTYQVQGVAVSDFTFPSYWRSFNSGPVTHVNGIVGRSMQVEQGGYISFMDPLTNIWYQQFGNDFQTLGQFEAKSNHIDFHTIREWTDDMARQHRA